MLSNPVVPNLSVLPTQCGRGEREWFWASGGCAHSSICVSEASCVSSSTCRSCKGSCVLTSARLTEFKLAQFQTGCSLGVGDPWSSLWHGKAERIMGRENTTVLLYSECYSEVLERRIRLKCLKSLRSDLQLTDLRFLKRTNYYEKIK